MASLGTALGAFGAFSSAFLAGGMNLVSTMAVPMVLSTTPPDASRVLQQWNFIYHSGHKIGPRLSVASGLIYFAAAYASADRARTVALYGISGALSMTMIPFTWMFIVRINNAIFAEIEKDKAGGPKNLAQAQYLVGRWRSLNIVRTFFPLFGAVLGLLTVTGLVQ